MSRTALTVLLLIAGVVIVLFVAMLASSGGMMDGMMGGWGGMMCPMWIIAWIGGVLVIALLIWLIVSLTRRTH